jgi:hypothetical protein
MAEGLEACILVRDFAEDPRLGLEVVVEGNLGRRVGWVHVTELVDPSPYMEGGGFILSAGVWDARGGRVDTFVGVLARAGAHAVHRHRPQVLRVRSVPARGELARDDRAQ